MNPRDAGKGRNVICIEIFYSCIFKRSGSLPQSWLFVKACVAGVKVLRQLNVHTVFLVLPFRPDDQTALLIDVVARQMQPMFPMLFPCYQFLSSAGMFVFKAQCQR
jgi:hypothetical protein